MRAHEHVASSLAFFLTLALGASGAAASEMQLGDVKVQVDTIVSVGTTIRTGGQDCAKISSANGGCADSGGTTYGINDDDGNVNSEQYDPVSIVAKAVSDIGVTYENYGGFLRVKAFYDYWNAEQQGDQSTRFGNRPMNDAYRGSSPRDFAGYSIDVLDAFVYGDFNVADRPLSVRVGRQVINWGESVFITGGINSYMPVDVQALRTPGSELKEALLPEASVFASLGLPNDVSVEGFYTFGYERTKLDACGTFFSTTDAACEGGAYVLSSSAAGTDDPDLASIYIPRIADDEARDQGQFGLAMRYYADWVNQGTEFGVYFVNYHSKLPIGTFTAADISTITITGSIPVDLAAASNTKEYQSVYPEDIQELGFSFNTAIADLLGGTALQGELLYTVDMPFQLSDVEINANDVENYFENYNPALGAFLAATYGVSLDSIYSGTDVAEGSVISGYSEYDVVTGQIGTTSTLASSNPVAGAIGSDLVILVGNAGFQWLRDYSSSTGYLATARSGEAHPNAITNLILGDACGCGSVQYADSFSWGYRLAVLADYNNVFDSAWKLQPFLQFGHDVKGYSAGPIGPGFVEGTKAVTIGTNASYQSWSASVSWTNRFGNEYYNSSYDKDFASFTVSYAF
ncbi:MAG: DUF1302 domain-containing protein [Parvibaculum sp.]